MTKTTDSAVLRIANTFQRILSVLFIIVLLIECFSQYKLHTRTFYIARVVLMPCLFLSIVDIQNVVKGKRLFYFALLATFIADTLTLKYSYPYYPIGIYLYLLSFILIGIAILKLRFKTFKKKKIIKYATILITVFYAYTNFFATEYQQYSMMFFFIAAIFMLYQAFSLKKQREKLATYYFIPFAIFCILSYTTYALQFFQPSGLLVSLVLFFGGCSYFFLGMGIRNLTIKSLVNNETIATERKKEI